MTWFTHKAIAVAGALALNASGVGIISTIVGSIFPDTIDNTLAAGSQERWSRIHRQGSHWAGWYIALIVIGTNSITFIPNNLPVIAEITTWIGFGALTHICLDALTPMGVPLWPLGGKSRIRLPLFSTGSTKEYVFLISALIIIAYYARWLPNEVYVVLNIHAPHS